jgi:segregation and condensation protein A
MKEILNLLLKKSFFIFSNVFSVEVLSRIEIITGFLAVLELSKAKKLTIKQKKLFDELYIYERTSKKHNEQEDMETDIRADASE